MKKGPLKGFESKSILKQFRNINVRITELKQSHPKDNGATVK